MNNEVENKNSEPNIKHEGGEMDHAEMVEELWAESQKNVVIEQLLAHKNLQEIIEALPGFQESFSEELDTIVCSDERVVGAGKKIGLAGQLILASEAEIKKFVDEYKGKIKNVTSHDNCGAAGIKYDLLSKEGKLPEGINDGDELGIKHSKKLAEMLDAKYYHINQSEMSGELHNARAVCFDGTGRFNPEAIKDMPEAYVCSGPGFGLSHEYNVSELNILTNIALGNHGFNGKFTAENPFYIFVSAYDQNRLNELIGWAREAVSEFGDRVEVKGFIAPAPEEEKL